MTLIRFFIVDAFTDTACQGNPAGVFFDDDGILSAGEMQQMAGEVGLESAFVTLPEPGSEADFRLRYFTGVTEVPFCGHDTVAAAVALRHAGRIASGTEKEISFATPVGILRLIVSPEGEVTMFQNRPTFAPPAGLPLTACIADALGCAVEAITATGLPVQVVSTGTPWLIVPVIDRAMVDAAPADFAAIERISRETATFGIYVFAIDPIRAGIVDGASVWSRCFAPIAGLNEDPVTGSASGALGGYLAQHDCLKAVRLGRIERTTARQGFAGKRGGTAEIVVERDEAGGIAQIAVSGTAVLVTEGNFMRRRPE
jgi:PhzF family phenazine biosynthesis protein